MTQQLIRAGIMGGAGYTAGELLRLLVCHPNVQVAWVNSTSQAGSRVDSVHQGLRGDIDLKFTDGTPFDQCDVLFMCTPHGFARPFLTEHWGELPQELRIVDFSQDYRISDGGHDFVYGLPELNRDKVNPSVKHVANPGCFATALQLALLPLAKGGLLTDDVHVSAITGSTGAGVKPGPTKHFSWRTANVSVYKAFTHQHLLEIGQTIRGLQPGFDHEIDFVPMRGPFARGIFAALYLKTDLELEQAQRLYEDYYAQHPFTIVSDKPVDLKDVVNTNKCLLHLEKAEGKLLITSVIDNLLKGAAGTAVHNMNLLFGLPETMGLRLKASAF